MAKKKHNKAQLIRDYLKENGLDTVPADMIAEFKAKRITISPAQISNIKTEMRGGKSSSPRGRKRSGQFDVNLLVEANSFARNVGGIENAREALKVLEKLQ